MGHKSRPSILHEFETLVGKSKQRIVALSITEEWKKTVLRNRARLRIFTILCSRPCINFNSICRATNMKPPSVRWHIRKLTEAGLIVSKKMGNKKLYMPEGMIASADTGIIYLLTSDSKMTTGLIEIVVKNPGNTLSEITRLSEASSPSVRRSLVRLKDAGLLRTLIDGRVKRYYISPKLLEIYMRYRKRERNFLYTVFGKFKADGINPEIIRRETGRVIIRLNYGGEKSDIVAIPLNPLVRNIKPIGRI